MKDDTVIARAATLVEAEMADDIFALNVEDGACLSFNATAAAIWRALEVPTRLDMLCAAMATDHDVDAETCRADTHAFVHQLVDQGLVTLTLA